MKKPLLIVLVVLVLGFAGVAGYIYLNADSLLARLRPELERIASQTMKTPVRLGELHLGIGLKPTITVDSVSVGESGDTRALAVKKVLLAVDLMPLLSKELKITELKIEKPHVTAVKSNGVVKIIGLPEKAAEAPQGEKAPRVPAAQQQGGNEKLPINFALEKFILTDGEIEYLDETPASPLPRVEIRELAVSSGLIIADNKLQLKDATVSTVVNQSLPVKITVGHIEHNLRTTDTTLERIILSLLGSQANIDGTLQVNEMKGRLVLSSSGFDLSKFEPLHAIVPALKQFPLSGSVAPEINITLAGTGQWDVKGTMGVKDLGTTVNNFSVSKMNGTVKLSAVPQQQAASTEDLNFTFQGSPMKLAFSAGLKGSEASLERLELSAFGGTISANASTTTTTPQLYKTTAAINSLSIDQALAAVSPQKASPLSGLIESVNANLNGELGERLKDTSAGRITFKIKDALLKQVNVAHEAFKGILTLPLIGDRIMAAVPEEFRAELLGNDTKIRYIGGTLNGTNGTFSTNDFVLLGSFFSIRGTGNLSMTGAVDLKTTISFNDRFSALLVERVKELRSAIDKNGEISFPLAISGIAPDLKIVPDMNALVKLGAETAVREGATRLLEGALKSKTGSNNDAVKGIGKIFGF